jgi:hypothetical protein
MVGKSAKIHCNGAANIKNFKKDNGAANILQHQY